MILHLAKQKKIERQFNNYTDQIARCMDFFQRALSQFVDCVDREVLQGSFENVKQAESIADDLRREIEVVMYSNALFPESRGDILGLIEAMDKIPNRAEATVRMIFIQHIPVYEQFSSIVHALVDTTAKCVEKLIEASRQLFTNFLNATVSVGIIDELESTVDRLETELIESIFSSDITGVRSHPIEILRMY